MKRKVFWLPCWRCLGGPPCRSVSALRHAPGPFAPSSTWQWGRCQQRGQSSFCLAGPKPVRSEEHPFGLPTNSPADQQLVEDDSILWLRVLQQPPTTLFTTFFFFFAAFWSPRCFRWIPMALHGRITWHRVMWRHQWVSWGSAGRDTIWGLRVEQRWRKVTCWFGVDMGQGLWLFSLCVFFFVILLLIVLVDLISFFLVGCWRGNMMQWYVYECLHYIDIFLSVGGCEKRQFQWFGQHAQFANWFHLGIWWWSCMWEKCFFPCWLGNENHDARDEEVMKHFWVWSLFWLGEICARVNIATLLLRCIFWM